MSLKPCKHNCDNLQIMLAYMAQNQNHIDVKDGAMSVRPSTVVQRPHLTTVSRVDRYLDRSVGSVEPNVEPEEAQDEDRSFLPATETASSQ